MNEIEELSPEDETRIARLRNRADCIQFAKNVEAKRPDLARAALRHAVELQVDGHVVTSPLLRDIWGAFYAYEEALFLKHGKRVRAGRTRKSLEGRGEIDAIEAIVLKPSPSTGFAQMQAAGLLDKTFEAVVLRNPKHFSPAAVDAAKAKLQPWLDAAGSMAPQP
ncbi:hypothetical protein [Paraburkholderia sp. BCC1876]|uniref:hypothetical protein n=1 Tax=Paraburkholderia sp. BCC1876 TaxID=2676303 RepID=UPI0015911654|nr:hypothetical protein [Paraburkholderia sp. BCC1876]